MASLSVVMIVRNAADCLRNCLESVRGVAHELVVADTGSTDATLAVAGRFGARILHVPWRNDFAAARNAALDAATGDWLLHMDADEVLDPGAAAAMAELLRADGGGADAIEITLRNYSNDVRAWRWQAVEAGDPYARGYAGYLPVGLLRLFRNGRGFEYREPIHESITESVVERGGRIAASPMVIHHYGFETTPEKVAEKRRFYYAIAREKVAQRPRDPKAWHDLAEQALAVGETAVAEEAALKTLECDPAHLPAATTLGTILLNRGDIAGARRLFERLEADGTPEPHVMIALGAIAYREGLLEEAETRLQPVVNAHPKDIQSRLYLARVAESSGASARARQLLLDALAIAPSLPELQNRLRAHDLREAAQGLLTTAPDATGLAHVMRGLVESLQLDPEDALSYRTLGMTLEALGQDDQAQVQFERANRLSRQRR